MKVIFLDIDGVLNCAGTKDRICGVIGIDSNFVKRLARIVRKTGAGIVLTSTWKKECYPVREKDSESGAYLKKKLQKEGLSICGHTEDDWDNRGEGIINWIITRDEPVEQWIVLDDEIFSDYDTFGIMPHLIRTSYQEGLKGKQARRAVKMLNKRKR